MYPKSHIFFGFVFSLLLFIFCPEINLLAAIIIFLSSFLIDIDHYFFAVWELKQKNIFKAYKRGISLKKRCVNLSKEQVKKLSPGFYIFHGLEILIVLFLLGFFVNKIFYFILFGSIFHLILDYIEIFSFSRKIHKFSAIYDYFIFKSNKTLKNRMS